MRKGDKASQVVRDMERMAPYMYEGLYGTFLRNFMTGDKSRWTKDLGRYLKEQDQDWDEIGEEIASLLWESFEKRISC